MRKRWRETKRDRQTDRQTKTKRQTERERERERENPTSAAVEVPHLSTRDNHLVPPRDHPIHVLAPLPNVDGDVFWDYKAFVERVLPVLRVQVEGLGLGLVV